MNNHEAKKRERFNAFVGNEKIRGKVQICSLNPDLGRFQPQGCHRHAGTNGPNGPAQPHLWPPCHGPAHVPGALCKLRPSGPAWALRAEGHSLVQLQLCLTSPFMLTSQLDFRPSLPLWSCFVTSGPDPDLQFDFVSWPPTCLNTMGFSNDLDSWLNLPTVSGSPPLGYCVVGAGGATASPVIPLGSPSSREQPACALPWCLLRKLLYTCMVCGFASCQLKMDVQTFPPC